MITNRTPESQNQVINLGHKALAGAISIGPAINLGRNNAAAISTDLFDYLGNPDTPLIPGKQGILNACKQDLKDARSAARLAITAGRDFCRQGIHLLQPLLGTRYNGAWNAAGFQTPSLAVPKAPLPMLAEFRQYFTANPARENVSLNLTAAVAQARLAAVQAAELAVRAADGARVDAQAIRDESFQTLRRRLSDLRSELEQLLEDDDGRWYDFGFYRPIDRNRPEPVTGLALTPLGSGAVRVTWDLATRAVNYRVSWRLLGGSSPIVEAGLFTDRQCALIGLPSGSEVVIGVTARNDSGETDATERSIIVP